MSSVRCGRVPAFASPACNISSRGSPWSGSTRVSARRPHGVFSVATSRRAVVRMCAKPPSPRSDDGSRDEEFDISDKPGSGKNELFEFVKTVPPPEMVARFSEAAPSVVQNAIRQTIVSMLGSLPPGAFSQSVHTVSSNLVQLFHSSLISGYMFRNAAYRLELTRSLGGVSGTSAPALPGSEDPPVIKGGVAMFKNAAGEDVEVPVEQYVDELRDQVNSLRDELKRERKGGNELLSFISTLEKENLESLTSNASPEVIDAMRRVVAVVTQAQGFPMEGETNVEGSSAELAQLLFYLMVSGFFLREAEVRVELQQSLGGDTSVNLNNLLGGTNEDNPKSEDDEGPAGPKDPLA